MMTQKELVGAIVSLEWRMFRAVQNEGGVASCQMMPETFRLMRESQADTWPVEALESYLADLRAADDAGRNLLSEKYARMMQFTHPDEYARIADQLAPLEEGASELIDRLVRINLEWKEDLARRFPRLNGQGRAIHSSDDSAWGTSVETYLRGEFMTYSVKTLRLLLAHAEECKASHANRAEAELLNQVRGYGYASLEAAEASLAGKKI